MTNPTAEGEEGLRHEPAPADGPWSKVRGPLVAGSFAVALVWAIANVANSPTETDTKSKQGESGQYQQSVIPLASSPQSSWPKLAIPAGGKSEIIPLPSGMRVIWAGYQFRNYTVYPDGHECAYNGTAPCPNGGTGTYANNETNVVNVVAYAFAPI